MRVCIYCVCMLFKAPRRRLLLLLQQPDGPGLPGGEGSELLLQLLDEGDGALQRRLAHRDLAQPRRQALVRAHHLVADLDERLGVQDVAISGCLALGGRVGMLSDAKRCSSTRSTPQTLRLVFHTGPPPMRPLTSMSRGPWLVILASTWNTPTVRPRARQLATHRPRSWSCWSLASVLGELLPVSRKYGSQVGQLSVTAA